MLAGSRTRVSSRRLLAVALVVAAAAAGRSVRAEDRVSFHAAYYREVNTKVVQPMLEITKDLPGGFDVGAHAAVDAISSASIAQGTSVDSVFEEKRYEASLRAGKRWDRLYLGVFGRYSRESDYFSYTGGLTVSRDNWGNTGTVALTSAFTHDDIVPTGVGDPKKLDVFFAGASYTQVLTPTTVAQAAYEVYFQHGFLANPYVQQQGLGREEVPDHRVRHAVALRVAQYVPSLRLGAQLHYRLYFDQQSLGKIGPWGMSAHTLDARVFKELGRDFEVRLGYRYHHEGDAGFWCNAREAISCYGDMPRYHSFDPKFGALHTSLAEAKLIWDLRLLAGRHPVLTFLSAGSFDVSYGYFFENTYYGALFTPKNEPPGGGLLVFPRDHGGAHLIQTGYSVPF
jgi:hypothetical protein